MPHNNFCQATRDLIFRSFHGQGGQKFRHVLGEFRTNNFSRGCQNVGTWQQQNGACKKSFDRFRCILQSINDNLNVLAIMFARQCNAIAAQRIRRAIQIVGLYNKLGYDRQVMQKVVERFGSSFLRRKEQPLSLLFAACLFSWKDSGISQENVDECVNELHSLKKPGQTCVSLPRDQSQLGTDWEKVIDRENLVLWRKPKGDGYLYEYKVFGTYKDITAQDFFMIQTDLDYRPHWDKLIVELGVIDRNSNTGEEVVHWVMHYPYPMYSREYVYVRKYFVDQEKQVMALMSHATDHPKCPITSKYVRVHDYMSNMVIKPHTKFDENGFDYVLTYYDDPQAAIPSPAYKWMAATGVPDFVNKMAHAAKQFHDHKRTTGGRDQESSPNSQQKDDTRLPM